MAVFIPAAVMADDIPLPSKRPQVFYASPRLLKDIQNRGDKSVAKPVYKAVKSRENTYELQVHDATKEDILEHLRTFHLEEY